MSSLNNMFFVHYIFRLMGKVIFIVILSAGGHSFAMDGEPIIGGTIIAGIGPAYIPGFNTHLTSIPDALAMAPVWSDGLIAYDGDGKRIPRLAKSWHISEDGKTYTFYLRENVKWSDGHPFTANDVVFTLNTFAKLNTYLTLLIGLIDKAEAPNDHTFKLTLKRPLTATLDLLDKDIFPLMAEHVYKDGNPAFHPANRNPVGLGPFKFDEWRNGISIKFVRNPYYWDSGKPYLDAVVFALISNPRQRLNALKRGEIDWVQLRAAQFAEARDTADENGFEFFKIKTNAPSRATIDFNLNVAPTNDVRVRKALFHAIDREAIARNAYQGFASTAVNAIPVQFKNLHDPTIDYNTMYNYDPEEAGRLLDEAGYPMVDGKRFSLNFTYATYNVLEPISKIVQANWRAIGIDINLINLELQLYIDRIYTQKDFQASLIYLTGRTNPVLGIDRSFVCNKGNVPYTNPTGYCNPKLDEIAMQAASASLSEQGALYSKYAAIVARDLNSITLTNAEAYEAFSTRIQNKDAQFNFSFDAQPNWAEAWLPKD